MSGMGTIAANVGVGIRHRLQAAVAERLAQLFCSTCMLAVRDTLMTACAFPLPANRSICHRHRRLSGQRAWSGRALVIWNVMHTTLQTGGLCEG